MTDLPATRIGIARVRMPSAAAAVEARVAVDRWVSTADLRPSGLSSNAILVVRRIAPRRAIPLSQRADLGAARRWEASVREELDGALRSARRPWFEPVGDDATAVLFADESELWACFLRDWANGEHRAHWWWLKLLDERSGTKQSDPPQPRTTELPAVFERLARREVLIEVVAHLPPSAREGWTRAASAELVPTRAGVEAPPTKDTPALIEQTAARARELLAIVPELADVRVPSEAVRLVAIALGYARARAFVRAPWFENAVARIARSRPTTRVTGDAPERAPDVEVLGAELPTELEVVAAARVQSRPRRSHTAPSAHRPSVQAKQQPTIDNVVQSTTSPSEPGSRTPHNEQHSAPVEPPSGVIVRASAPPVVTEEAAPRSVQPASSIHEVGIVDEVVEERAAIDSDIASLFFLANVFLSLGWYPDFTRPVESGIALDIWDAIALFGRKIVGEHADDPIWSLLADLAQRREGDPIGAQFVPPDEWRVPDAWLTPFDVVELRGTRYPDRIRVEHPAKFVVADLSREFEPLVGSLPIAWEDDDATAAPTTGLQRWVEWVTRYIRARVALALDGASVVAALSLPGRVVFSASRVDVHLSIATLPIEVRYAGLDRDPGWLPSGGRTLAFHFA